ncbi:DUF6000 family protein [Promicromonospora sukumoe]
MSTSSSEPGYTREQLRLFRRLVRSFYLRMYLVEAPTEVDPRAARRFRRRLVRAGRRVTPQQVGLMLRGGGWREMTMGAWFALAVPADDVRGAVLEAWSAVGRHAAGPLTSASVLVIGPDAIPAMRSFVARSDGYDDPGTAEYVSAAIAHLGGSPPSAPNPAMQASFEESLDIAAELRSDFLARRRTRRIWTMGS